ncbi:FAD-binding protein [Paraburkholderia sp. RL17-373-BIF-A]|uniref:FAD-binding protein n=1 Tax=Paraburkholderia sp. RL17-373-BIF-A TaxID=3031629 RepID=UPI0038BD1F9A
MARLYKTLRDRQVEVWLHASATRLITEDGTVVGAEVICNRRASRVRARGGVVIATGGYPGNADMRREHSRKPTVNLKLGLMSNAVSSRSARMETASPTGRLRSRAARWRARCADASRRGSRRDSWPGADRGTRTTYRGRRAWQRAAPNEVSCKNQILKLSRLAG